MYIYIYIVCICIWCICTGRGVCISTCNYVHVYYMCVNVDKYVWYTHAWRHIAIFVLFAPNLMHSHKATSYRCFWGPIDLHGLVHFHAFSQRNWTLPYRSLHLFWPHLICVRMYISTCTCIFVCAYESTYVSVDGRTEGGRGMYLYREISWGSCQVLALHQNEDTSVQEVRVNMMKCVVR